MTKECIFVDVFTDKPYAGNQLAVFPDGKDLATEQMQRLAQEINYSETTFVLDAEESVADFMIRIFTPSRELPFAGHPTLGTAYSIMEHFDIWQQTGNVLKLETKVGVIPLEKEKGVIWMTQNKPEFFVQHSDKEQIAELFGLLPADISDQMPTEEVSTGNRMLIVPIKTLRAVQGALCNVSKMRDFFGSKLVGPYVFSLETTDPSAAVHTRFFAPHLGILEDPATGSAAGPLTGYLLKHRIFGDRFEILNEQGVEMGRPSKIMMRGRVQDDEYQIKVGGNCAYVGKAEFEI